MSVDETEVAELRHEVERLQQQLADASRDGTSHEGPTPVSARDGRWRPFVATVLIVLAALLAPLAVVATWAHDQVSDTDRYVATVTPLASDPAVQKAIVDRITTELFNRIDVQAVTKDAVDALASRGLPPAAAASLSALSTPLANGVHSFVEKEVAKLVASPAFEEAWIAANREAHAQVVAVLTGKTNGTVQVNGDSVQVNLAAVIDTIKQRLVDSGFSLASRIPEVNAQFTVMQSADLAKAQNAFRVLSAASRVLPWLAVALLAAGVWVARSRRRTLVIGSLAIAGSMLLLGAFLNFFRVVYLDAVPPSQLAPDAAAAVYDALVHYIRIALRSVLLLFLIIAAFAWVSGPGPAPSALRRGTNHAVDSLRSGTDRAGLRTGRLGAAAFTYRTPIRGVVLGLALLVYVMAAHPTAPFTLVLLGITLVVLLVVEVLAHPPAVGNQPPAG